MNLPLIDPPANPPSECPRLPWHKRVMRERHLLEYWLADQHHQQWVCSFRELGLDTIEFEDYVTRRNTRIRSPGTIAYRITRYQ